MSSQFDVFRLQLPAISAGLARIGLSWKGNKSVLLSCSITRLEETRNSKSAKEDNGEIEKPDNCAWMYIELRLLHTSAVFHMILNKILLVLDTVEKAVRRLKLTHHPRECIANRNTLLWCSTDIYGFSATSAPEGSSTGIYPLIAETLPSYRIQWRSQPPCRQFCSGHGGLDTKRSRMLSNRRCYPPGNF